VFIKAPIRKRGTDRALEDLPTQLPREHLSAN